MPEPQKKTAPAKPSPQLLWLAENPVVGVEVSYDATGTDTAETNVTLTSRSGVTKQWRWATIKGSCEVAIDHFSILRLNREARRQVDAWLAFEKENAEDLAELARLKEKLGL